MQLGQKASVWELRGRDEGAEGSVVLRRTRSLLRGWLWKQNGTTGEERVRASSSVSGASGHTAVSQRLPTGRRRWPQPAVQARIYPGSASRAPRRHFEKLFSFVGFSYYSHRSIILIGILFSCPSTPQDPCPHLHHPFSAGRKGNAAEGPDLTEHPVCRLCRLGSHCGPEA